MMEEQEEGPRCRKSKRVQDGGGTGRGSKVKDHMKAGSTGSQVMEGERRSTLTR
jgi:hypothetical protein